MPQAIAIRNARTGYIYQMVYSYKQAFDYMESQQLRVDQWFLNVWPHTLPVQESGFAQFTRGRSGLSPEVWHICTGLNSYPPQENEE